MQNLLITGGCGFIGSNFIRYLLKREEFQGRIINVDNLTYAGNPENLADIEAEFPERYVFTNADICLADKMAEVFDAHGIDTICHFAAESHVDRSIVDPDAFIQTNIVGTFNLLELARSHQDRLVLFHHVSTDEVFGSLGPDGYFIEETPYKPNSPYSASKASSDHLVRAYHKTYGLPITISNCSNNYGPYQFPEKLIPLMILNALDGKQLPVYGDGKNVRDWLYVIDHCEAIVRVLENGVPGETYNIGGNSEQQNIDIVHQLCELMDGRLNRSGKEASRNLIQFVTDRPGHDRRYAIDSSKVRKEIGWKPRYRFEQALEATVDWYLKNMQWAESVRSGGYREWTEKNYAKRELERASY
jgi:dTDP-glucose 4,6-dehydratase